MGTARQGYNLFNKHCHHAIWDSLKRGRLLTSEYFWKDSFGRFVCKVIGHASTFDTDDIPPEKICRRCYQPIK